MYCKNCGEKLRDGADFCANCGSKVMSLEDNPQTQPMSKTSSKSSTEAIPHKSMAVKIAAVALAGALIGGGAVGMVIHKQANNKPVAEEGLGKGKEASDPGKGNDQEQKRASAFLKKIEEIENQYGDGSVIDDNKRLDGYYTYQYCQGLAFAQLLDADDDSEKELIIAYGGENLSPYFNQADSDTENSLNYAWTVEVWDYTDKGLARVYQGTPYMFNGQDPIGQLAVICKLVGNKLCFVEGYTGWEQCLSVTQIEESNSKLLHEYRSESADSGNMEFDYTIDGEEVSEKEYMESKDQWFESSDSNYYTLFTYTGFEDNLPSIDTTVKTVEEVKAQLKENSNGND